MSDFAKVGCVVVAEKDGLFHAIKCKKGRGIILPGGAWEPDKDPTYRHAAAREFREEIGLKCDPLELEYIFQAPDGYGYTTIAFRCRNYSGTPIETAEGVPVLATLDAMKTSKFGAWYDLLGCYAKSMVDHLGI